MATTVDPVKIEYYLTKGNLESMNNKYIGNIIHNGSMDIDELAEEICKDRPYLDEPTVKLVIGAVASEVRREVGENVRYVSLGANGLGLYPAISGSVPAMDSELSEENKLYVNIVASSRLRKILSQIQPTLSDIEGKVLIIDKIEDSTTGDVGQIHINRDFVVTGYNISAAHTGESLKLIDKTGAVVATATIMGEDGMGQRIEASFTTEATIEPGNYKLRLTSRGYSTPTGDLNVYDRGVKVV